MAINRKLKPKKKKRCTKFTVAEDKAWTWAFCYYADGGFSDKRADELAWNDMCIDFPRLKKYGGVAPVTR